MTNEALARRLRILRAARGISLREAEKLTDVTRETLGALEHGQRGAHTGTLQKIATGYGVSVSDLMREGLEAEEVLLSKAKASEAEAARAAVRRSPLAQVTLDAPHIRAWLNQQRATHALMSDDDFEDEVIASEPRALLRAVEREREQVLDELRKPETRTTLFPNNVAAQVTKDARIAEAMMPYRKISRLRLLVEREYTFRTRILENYIEHLALLEAQSDEAQSDEARREAFREEAALVRA
jgi:transcriptional regulator with XRE-family HTH domain